MGNEIIYTDKNGKSYGINEIIKGECIEVLKGIKDESVDVIFADPPYFMQSTDKALQRADGTGEFRGCDDEWDKFKDYDEYDTFCKKWLTECKRILKKDGTIWVIGSFQNIYRIGYLMQNLGFWILNDIVWSKTNPTPNMSGSRFCNAHETLLWCSKSKKSKFTFNYKTMKYLNGNKQDKSVWSLNICQGGERLRNDDGEKLHTTQKPEALLKKVILSSSKVGDIILDPFFGTGTTGAVAKRYGRNFVGIKRDDKYIKGATIRISNTKDESDEISNLTLEVKPPKVPMNKLIELGLLKVGEALYDKDGNIQCHVCEDGAVCNSTSTASIHKMAAKILNKSNCNGWNFFYIKRNEKLECLDTLRYEAINHNLL